MVDTIVLINKVYTNITIWNSTKQIKYTLNVTYSIWMACDITHCSHITIYYRKTRTISCINECKALFSSIVSFTVVPQPLIGEANLQSSNKFTDNTLILSAVLSAACALIVCGIVVAIHNKWRSRHSRRRVDMRVHRTDEDYSTTSQKTTIATITT